MALPPQVVQLLREKTGREGHTIIAEIAAACESSGGQQVQMLKALLGRLSAACREGQIAREPGGFGGG